VFIYIGSRTKNIIEKVAKVNKKLLFNAISIILNVCQLIEISAAYLITSNAKECVRYAINE